MTVPTPIPTFVVIPVVAGEREQMTDALCRQILEQLGPDRTYIDASDRTITEKWNVGLEWAGHKVDPHLPYNVAFLNNDLILGDHCLPLLANGLRKRPDIAISYPNIYRADLIRGDVGFTSSPEYAGQSMAGYCFMVRGESKWTFDEQFKFWYADADLERRVRDGGGLVATVGGATCEHLLPTDSTRKSPELLEIAKQDEKRFAKKHRLNANSLWLAAHPAEFE